MVFQRIRLILAKKSGRIIMTGFFKRKKPPKDGYVTLKLCPVCGSVRLKKLNSLSGWISQEQYVCEDCGYTGTVFLEVEVPYDEAQTIVNEEH